MAGQLNWICDVTTDDGVMHPASQVVVRNNVATLTALGASVGVEKSDVALVTLVDARHANVVFLDGATWTAVRTVRKGGCGCG